MQQRIISLLLCVVTVFLLLIACTTQNTQPSGGEPDLPLQSGGVTENDSQPPQQEPKPNDTQGVGDESDPPAPELPSYTVVFYTNGGTEIAPTQYVEGTKISTLPKPYRQNYLFAGWYYDQEFTGPVAADAEVTSTLTLYAKYDWVDMPAETATVGFTSSRDVSSDFSIVIVSSDSSLTAEQVEKMIKAQNLSDPQAADFIKITGGGGKFVLSGKGGFAEGNTFRMQLNDSRLSFEGQNVSVREYNFTTDMDETVELQFVDGIIYVSIDQLQNIIVNGQASSTMSSPLYSVSTDGKLSSGGTIDGQFTYTGSQQLCVGDTVVVYAGLRPDLRDENATAEQNGDVSYIKITAVSGNVYSYTGAEVEDILLRPDLLPISIDNDLDTSDTSVTLYNQFLDFSDDIYTKIRLDANTTVDVGDFLTFYSGVFGVSDSQVIGYGRVTEITVTGSTTVISYNKCTWEDVESSMDLRAEDQINGEQLLEGIDVEDLENQIEEQALASGFAEEAAIYLVSVATATENFTTIPDELNLSDIRVILEDGTEISPEELRLMGGDVKASVAISRLKARISSDLKHFDDASGFRLTLEIGVKISFVPQPSDPYEYPDKQLVLEIVGTFEQELCFAVDVNAYAVWNNWGPYFYIEDFRMIASLDMDTYSGIGFEVTAGTKEKIQNGEYTGMVKVDKFIQDIIKALKLGKAVIGGSEVNVADQLVEQYTDMLNHKTDWVYLVEQKIIGFQIYFPPACPILVLEMNLDFVISVDASVSLGLDFYYMSGTRYVYIFDVFSLRIFSDVINMREETCEFTAYALGRLGLRAGVRAELLLGFIDTDCAAVGFSIEAGAYIKAFGYFYYEFRHTEAGDEQKRSGAVFLEIGGYMTIGFEAHAFVDLFSYSPTLYEKEWPIWTVGARENVLDFVTEQKDMPEIKLKSMVQSTVLSDSLFEMSYLDLREGGGHSAMYDDGVDFEITISNDKFSYDPATNIISVTPSDNDSVLEGTMTITWISDPLVLTSNPMERTISLHWDNQRSGYVIIPFTQGGSYVPIIDEAYGTEISIPKDPTKVGYVFAGWYADEDCTVPYSFPAKMPAEDVSIYASWTPANDTVYTVEHYQQILGSSNYELIESQRFTGMTGSAVLPDTMSWVGFVTPVKQTLTVLPDGSAVLHYFYDRVVNTLTFNGGALSPEEFTIRLQYGASVCAPKLAVPGYEFLGWDQEVSPVMGDQPITYVAQWKKIDVEYRVEYYVQNAEDGRDVLQEQVYKNGLVDSVLTANELLYEWMLSDGRSAAEKFLVPGGVEFSCITVGGENLTVLGKDPAVADQLVIKVIFRRVSHSVTFDPANGQNPIKVTLYYGASVKAPDNLTRDGYAFVGWDKEIPSTMGTEDITLTAVWSSNDYTVSFDANGGEGKMDAQGMLYDTSTALQVNLYVRPGYDFIGWATSKDSAVVYADGAEVENLTSGQGSVVTLYAVWQEHSYKIHYNLNGGSGSVDTPVTYTVLDTMKLPTAVRPGYIFCGWMRADGEIIDQIDLGSTGDLVLTAQWEASNDTVYTVEHWLDGLEGEPYELFKTEVLNDATDAMVTPAVMTFAGFTSPAAQSVTVNADGSTVVKYYYTRNTYTITFVFSDGESTDHVITKLFGTKIVMPQPQRDGYGFGGWYTNESCSGNSYFAQTMGAENLTLYAMWTANEFSYTVEHRIENLDGSWTVKDAEQASGKMDQSVTPATRSYVGFTTPDAKSFIIGAEDNVFVYEYKRNSYTLTWNLDGGQATDTYTTGTVLYGTPITTPILTKTGYTFVSWDKEIPATMPDGDLTLSAIWQIRAYTVTFYFLPGEVYQEVTLDFASELTVPADPIRSGYTFAGWDATLPGTMPARNISLTAKWTANEYSYTVVHRTENLDGSFTVAETETLTGKMDQQVSPDYKSYPGFTSPSAKTTITIGVGENVVTYDYKRNQYVLTWDFGGGIADGDYTSGYVKFGEEIVVPKLTRDHYQFRSWSLDIPAIMPFTDLTVTASWDAVVYYIYFDAASLEGQVVEKIPYTVEDGQIDLAIPEGSPLGKIFGGWYTDSSLTGKITGNVFTVPASPEDVTVYAAWTPRKYYITFCADLGDTTSKLPVPGSGKPYVIEAAYGSSVTLPTPEELGIAAPEYNPGYTFLGWSDVSGGSVKFAAGSDYTVEKGWVLGSGWNELEEGVELFACWQLNEYDVKFVMGDCAADGQDFNRLGYKCSVEMETIDLTLSGSLVPAVKPGYKFLGWYSDPLFVNKVDYISKDDYSKSNLPAEITLYARYEGIVYTITFDKQGADQESGTPAIYLKYGTGFYTTAACTTYVHKIDPPTKQGYTFGGYYLGVQNNSTPDWSAQDICIDKEGNLCMSSVQFTRDMTVYALWKPNEYRIVYNANGGSGTTANSEHTYGVSSSLTPNGFSKHGWKFSGWSESPNAIDGSYEDRCDAKYLFTGEKETVTLYAIWKLETSATFSVGEVYVPNKISWPGRGFEITNKLDVNALIDQGYYYTVTIQYDLNVHGDHLYAICQFQIGTDTNGFGDEIYSSGEIYYERDAVAHPTHTTSGRNAGELRGNTYCGVFFGTEGMSWFDQINKYTASNIMVTFTFYK